MKKWVVSKDGYTVMEEPEVNVAVQIIARCQTVVIATDVAEAHNASVETEQRKASILDADWVVSKKRYGPKGEFHIFILNSEGEVDDDVQLRDFLYEIAALPDALRALKMVRDKTMEGHTIALTMEDCQMIDLAMKKAEVE